MISKEIREKLSSPIPVSEIGWKPQTVNNGEALMVAYVDARWVAERLDEATDGNWSFTFEAQPIYTADSIVIKGSLTVCGLTREDVGEYHKRGEKDDIEQYKAAVSDALKRAAVHFGVGRELYRMDAEWVKWDTAKRRVADGEMDRLRARLTVHWTKTDDLKNFVEWAAKQSLSTADLEKALGCKPENYTKTKADALAAVKKYVAEKAK